ncbi:MAG TPA: HigA family addiction module antitoxin [Chloroflexota bacterium]|nr:HigA family addiction module antitoxin [Chloroflexota bacterium]
MATEWRSWQPEWAVAPGEILQEALEDRGMSQSELARRMGRPIKTINEIINGKAAITPDTAIQLERTLGITASFWNSLETMFREHLARERALEELEANADWAGRFPIKDLERNKLIQHDSTRGGRVAALLSYFGVASREAWEKQWLAPAVAFRRSPAFASSPEATAAWLRWGELVARKSESQPFDPRRLREVLKEVKRLTRQADFVQAVERARALLASAGVVLVLTPEFKGTHISGAARWIGPDKALIQLSMRHRSNDHFWFSLFHEVGHLFERKRSDYLDVGDNGSGADPAEKRADEFARDSLIAPSDYAEFIAARTFTAQSVRDFASQQGIAPGLVVGRLQQDGYADKSHLNDLKKPIRWPSAL